jgi:hypothetical protein
MRRHVLGIVAACLLTALLLPAAAQANKTYKVLDTSGRRVGTIDPRGVYKTVFRTPSGDEAGYVSLIDGYWLMFVVKAGVADGVGGLDKAGRDWKILSNVEAPGRARCTTTKWVLQQRVKGRWVTRGWVAKGVEGRWAAGALRALLWK